MVGKVFAGVLVLLLVAYALLCFLKPDKVMWTVISPVSQSARKGLLKLHGLASLLMAAGVILILF